MKIERLAGIAGKPEVELAYGHEWYVYQSSPTPGAEQVYGPVRETEQSAIRAWNVMVRRIVKAAREQKL